MPQRTYIVNSFGQLMHCWSLHALSPLMLVSSHPSRTGSVSMRVQFGCSFGQVTWPPSRFRWCRRNDHQSVLSLGNQVCRILEEHEAKTLPQPINAAACGGVPCLCLC
ncbi:unnamed protein product [Protopolystoma xenopodis]|uniref:Uncharacterized protein n=1 Tax=Protopolystoma xenopodis TaxID=117903 RepID=A0A448X0H8_9PLAT|nr:unnamed protein product [Protopolystoma xenopodis]